MISILIRNRDEAQHIGFAIQSCIDHFENPEILILDNKSSDESLKICSMFDKHDLKILKVGKNYSPGYALNFGVQNSKYENILILSAHCQIINFSSIQSIEKIFDEGFKAVFGKQIPIFKGKKITPRYIWSHFVDVKVENMFSQIENRQFLHNAFCFYKKSILLKHPFDEHLSGKEDRYWAIARVEDNMKYLYDPSIVCNHFYTEKGATWKGLG